MSRVGVLKFGGAALGTLDDFATRSELIAYRRAAFDRLIVVVSAMRNWTSELLRMAERVHDSPPRREQDMLVTVGERVTASLMAMALDRIGIRATSLTGSQSGIITDSGHTDAKIIDVRPTRVATLLEQGEVVVVAGFQGVSVNKEITSLGRGGSDTTAVALGVALEADHVEFYKDVAGVYRDDPKVVPDAAMVTNISHQGVLDQYQATGRCVIHPRALQLALHNSLSVAIKPFNQELGEGTWIGEAGRDLQGPRQPIYEASL